MCGRMAGRRFWSGVVAMLAVLALQAAPAPATPPTTSNPVVET